MAAVIGTLAAPSALRAQETCDQCDLPPACRTASGDEASRSNSSLPRRRNCQTLAVSIESDIDFGRVVILGKGEGRVALDLNTGEKRLIGSLDDLGGVPITGHVVVTGAPFEAVRVDLPGEVTMRGPTGGNARIREFVTTLPGLPVLDADGRLEFRFAATLVIDKNTRTGGNLRGRVPIRVEYL